MKEQLETIPSTSAGHPTFWMLVPVVLLGASVLGVGSIASVAARDPGFALEKNYYERAVHWDQQQAEWAENARLGYRLELGVVPVEHGAELVLQVVDRTGAALHGASVRVEAFANARSAERQTLELAEALDGTYRASIGDPRPGLWEFRCAVSQGGDRYTEVLRRDVTRSAAP